MAAVLLLSIILGAKEGQKVAQSEQIIRTGQNIFAGLNYFYKDQNRYPTVSEFSDKSIMLNYFSAFPPVQFVSGSCTASFVYKRSDSKNFELDFCLPTSLKNYSKGWGVWANPAN